MISFVQIFKSRRMQLFLSIMAIVVSVGFAWGVHNHVTSAQSGYYQMDMIADYNWDGWACSGAWGNCNFLCNATNAGRWCEANTCLGTYEYDSEGNLGNIQHQEFVCNYYPPACTADSSCAANTCSDSTCSDSCGNVYTGTKNCAVCSPSMGTACNVNACGVAGGTVQCNGSCSGATPWTNAGTACTSPANSCGETTTGTYTCGGNCSASAPAVVDACPSASDPGTQCSASQCTVAASCNLVDTYTSEVFWGDIAFGNCVETNNCAGKCAGGDTNGCVATYCDDAHSYHFTQFSCICGAPAPSPQQGQPCTSAPNSCGVTMSGTIQYDGSCSASTPAVVDACPSTPLIQCSVSECVSLCASNQGSPCNVNACGVAGGTVQCDSSCSGATPPVVDACPANPFTQCSVSECVPVCAANEGASCTRTNSCSESNTGTIQCDGLCSVSAPPDTNCPTPLQPPPLTITADRTQVSRGDIVQISWNAGTIAPFNCSVYGPNFGPFNFNPSVDGSTGTEPSDPINAKSEFTIVCVDPPYGTRYMSSTFVETTGLIEER